MRRARLPKPGSGRLTLLVAVLVTAVVVGLVGWSVGRLSTLENADPSNTSAEAGFARDMQVHHNQGVELSLIIRDLTDDAPTRLLAYDIATTQGQQSGQMYGWLSQWGLPQAGSEPAMTWMTRPGLSGSGSGHDHTGTGGHSPGDPMPGLATPDQIAALSAASDVEAERLFLTLMIAHHQGAVEMADAVLDRSDHSVVRAFAKSVVASQTSEIELMRTMLAQRTA
jgi:uncharacterized protein (DUF305 family)